MIVPSKYKNKRTTIDGITFDSTAEAKRWSELKVMERAREITHLERQYSFALLAENGVKISTYVADFTYFDKKGKWIIEDVKGLRTPMYNLKKKWMAAQGCTIMEIGTQRKAARRKKVVV